MPKLYTKLSFYSAFVIMFVLLVVNAGITRRQLSVQVAKRGWSDHSRQVLLAISDLGSELKDAETGQRGYLYTGEPSYLEPYHDAGRQVESTLQKLANLTLDNPQQQSHIAVLRDLCRSKLSELSRTVDLYQNGKQEEAKQVVLSNVGRHLMDQIRDQLDQMWRLEADLSAVRDREYERSVEKTKWSIYIASAIAIVGLALLTHFVLLQIRQRELHTSAIREREEWFRTTLSSIGDAVLATDRYGVVTFINEVAQHLTGLRTHEISGKHISEVFPIFNEHTGAPVENPVAKVFATGKIVGMANHTVLRHRGGRLIPIEDSAAPIRNDAQEIVGVVLVFRDATHERHSQQLLRRAEKLAAAGRLASTMAHEINNPLEAVGNLIFIARHSAGVPDDVKQHLLLAEQQLSRVAHLTRQTLGFHREQATPQEVQLATLVEGVLTLYENKFKAKGITVTRDFRDVPTIIGLSGELQQLIANLVSNAADAVQKNGAIGVSILPASHNGDHGLELQVEDDGAGVPPENIERIFEPFFTTKTDVGTGLGLWVVKEVAERYGGSVKVVSRDHQQPKTVFSVFLPTREAEPAMLSTTA